MAEILMKHRLHWLGHLARMESHRMPKQLLFGELEKKRRSHGTKQRWRDVAAADIKSVNAGAEWYDQECMGSRMQRGDLIISGSASIRDLHS